MSVSSVAAPAPAGPASDAVLRALAISKRRCSELLPEADWLSKLVRSEATGVPLRIKLGLDPEQTDYEDYRAVDGVWLPFTVRVSYLDDNHYGTTRRITEVKQNVSLDDQRFDPPPVSP